MTERTLDIGIGESDRKQIAVGLGRLLADTYTLLLKTHNYHWNVTGPHFGSLHLLFEGQYTELFAAVDLIAERIRALGSTAPGSYRQFSELASVKDATSVPRAMEMVRELMLDNERVAKTAREVFPIAEAGADEATIDLLNQRLNIHQKTAWMLRSTLEE